VAGKVLDTSAVAAWAEGRVSIQAWVGVARTRGLTLLVPSLARIEVLSLRPGSAELIDQLTAHPHVLVIELTDSDRSTIESLLSATGTSDVLAAWVVHTCRQRGWAALTADPDRLRRLDPNLETDLL
jgi:hypothetical protein